MKDLCCWSLCFLLVAYYVMVLGSVDGFVPKMSTALRRASSRRVSVIRSLTDQADRQPRFWTGLHMSTLPDPHFSPTNRQLGSDELSQKELIDLALPSDVAIEERSSKLLTNTVVASAVVASLWLYGHPTGGGGGVLPHSLTPDSVIDLITHLCHQATTSVPVRVAGDALQQTWDRYETILTDAPIATKAATSAAVYTIGDILSQQSELGDDQGEGILSLDAGRMLRSMIAGLIGHGPLSHFWYNHLESLFSMWHINAEWWSFLPKVAIDQTVWGPIWNNTYILLLGLMKRESIERIVTDMKTSTVPLITTGVKLWVPAHFITYGLIPVQNRLLWVDLVEILWVSILASQAASAAAGGSAKEAASDPSR